MCKFVNIEVNTCVLHMHLGIDALFRDAIACGLLLSLWFVHEKHNCCGILGFS